MALLLGATLLNLPIRAAQPSGPVTFSRDVAPLVFNRCAGCHRPGGAGPFSLLNYATVRQHAQQIAEATARRVMPPWQAEPGYGAFIGRRPLTDAEIALIQRWFADGALEGDPKDLPPQPHWNDDWQLGEPDLVVSSEATYTLPAAGGDTFHVFVVRVPGAVTRYVTGIEFRPSNPRVVHHANILLDRTSTSRDRNQEDPTLGERGLLAATAIYPPGHFLGWTPGEPDPLLPDSLAWRLEPDTDLVVQLHLKPSGKPEPIHFTVGFFFGARAPARTPAVLRLSRQDIDIPAGEPSYQTSDAYELPVDVEVLALKPHAHYRAREIRAFAVLPDGETSWLLYIKSWDFQWQHTYRFVTPVMLPAGTRISMVYVYDNGADSPHNPELPPRRVRWGPRSNDEMADLWVQVVPRNAGELAILNRDFRRKWATDDAVGYEGLIAREPGDPTLRSEAAALYLELGNPVAAVGHLEAIARLRPASAIAQFNLGAALMMAGEAEPAALAYAQALRIDPAFVPARNNLGSALAALGRLDEALEQYRQVVRMQPSHAGAANNIGFILLERGRIDEATPFLLEALRLDPLLADAHYNLGLVLRRRGETAQAVDRFREAVRLKPDWTSALTELAWILTTASELSLRNPTEAIRLAERASVLSGGRDARVLEVLAAAYAADGR